MNHKQALIVFALLAGTAMQAQAADVVLASWADMDVFEVKAPGPTPDGYTSWRIRGSILPGAVPHDISVDTEMSDGRNLQAGSVMIVDNVMALKGEGFKQGATSREHWFENAEAAATMGISTERLLLQVMAAAYPQGPSALKASQTVDHTEDKQPLQLITAYYAKTVHPPWKVTGTVKRGDDGVVDYDLTLTLYAPGHPDEGHTSHFTGKMSHVADPSVPADTSLVGWEVSEVQVLPPRSAATQAATQAAQPVFHTVGELRAALKAEEDPGTPDPKRDFAGYWQEHCGEGLGSKFAHEGTDGLYHVSNCGNACSDRFYRKTYVTGDRHYQVVSDDLIIVYSPSGKSRELHRCPGPPPPSAKQ